MRATGWGKRKTSTHIISGFGLVAKHSILHKKDGVQKVWGSFGKHCRRCHLWSHAPWPRARLGKKFGEKAGCLRCGGTRYLCGINTKRTMKEKTVGRAENTVWPRGWWSSQMQADHLWTAAAEPCWARAAKPPNQRLFAGNMPWRRVRPGWEDVHWERDEDAGFRRWKAFALCALSLVHSCSTSNGAAHSHQLTLVSRQHCVTKDEPRSQHMTELVLVSEKQTHVPLGDSCFLSLEFHVAAS